MFKRKEEIKTEIKHYVRVYFTKGHALTIYPEGEEECKDLIKRAYLSLLDGKVFHDEKQGLIISPTDFSHGYWSWKEVKAEDS